MKKPNPDKDELFMQGFCWGFCACLDMLREQGMRELPDKLAQGLVMFADGAEAHLKSEPVLSRFVKYGSTPEARMNVVRMIFDSSQKPEAGA